MNFALLLFILLVISGVMWVLDVLWLKKQRLAAAAAALADFDARHAARAGDAAVAAERDRLQDRLTRRPWYLEYTASFFPVILVVFVLRSFFFEPFRIPSGSMIPTLQIGDLILVNKYQYGVRLPVIHTKILDLGTPQRGDVMVFRFPHNPTQDYIKRVVGLPGDRVEYINRRLIINGEPVPLQRIERYYDEGRVQYYDQFIEKLGAVEHRIILNDGPGVPVVPAYQHTHPHACTYGSEGVSCVVPPGHYFVMGDNRDNSEDSRFWGFVPEGNIVGRAFFIWMNFGNISRIGSFH
ncbi:MAG: signal peptidase I [Sutterellaceae bacterium]|nr:signal peptidase I [Burkholderiaceae bacterium]MDW8429813.1 signal peptidase I [Sutterellaceae bacterium]